MKRALWIAGGGCVVVLAALLYLERADGDAVPEAAQGRSRTATALEILTSEQGEYEPVRQALSRTPRRESDWEASTG